MFFKILWFFFSKSGEPVYENPFDPHGDFTHFIKSDMDKVVGCFPRMGEFYFFSPILVPHGAAFVPGLGPSSRMSVEFRFQLEVKDMKWIFCK